MKTTEFLIQEHKLILRSLDVLDAMTGAVAEASGVETSDIEAILNFLSRFADEQHQAKEERILFPALNAAAASEQRRVDHMILEHDQERALLKKMEGRVRAADLPEFVECANKLSSAVRNHIYKEEYILFEMVDATLSVREDEAVAEQLRAFNGAAGEPALRDDLAELRRLEWKYLGRLRRQIVLDFS
jgi:hemerythrin-like domain-containing protein